MLTLMPGPDILFVITQSIARRPGDGIVHTTVAAFGISAILYQSSLAFQVVKVAGAIYLLYLAWQSLREKEGSDAAATAGRSRSFFALYRRGIWMNLLNPKVSLFFLAFLSQFVSPEARGGSPANDSARGHLYSAGVVGVCPRLPDRLSDRLAVTESGGFCPMDQSGESRSLCAVRVTSAVGGEGMRRSESAEGRKNQKKPVFCGGLFLVMAGWGSRRRPLLRKCRRW